MKTNRCLSRSSLVLLPCLSLLLSGCGGSSDERETALDAEQGLQGDSDQNDANEDDEDRDEDEADEAEEPRTSFTVRTDDPSDEDATDRDDDDDDDDATDRDDDDAEASPEIAELIEASIDECELAEDGDEWLCSLSDRDALMDDLRRVRAVDCFVRPDEQRFDCFAEQLVLRSTRERRTTWVFDTPSGLLSDFATSCQHTDYEGWFCDSPSISCDFNSRDNHWECFDDLHRCSLDRADREWTCEEKEELDDDQTSLDGLDDVLPCRLSERRELFVCPLAE